MASSAPEFNEQIEHLIENILRSGAVTVDFVDDDHRPEPVVEGLAQHEAGLRHRPLKGVDEQQAAIGHFEDPLDLAAEVGMAWRIDEVDAYVPVPDRDVFGQDGDAALALLVVGVQDAVFGQLGGAELAALPQHLVDQRGFAVIDMGDNRNVAEFVCCLHVRSFCPQKTTV